MSTSGDPTGSYFRYEFQYQNFPDYPKIGVWPDAYYATFNLFDERDRFQRAGDLRVRPREDARRPAGDAAVLQARARRYGGVLPPTSTARRRRRRARPTTCSTSTTNALNFWKFHVDWANPANTTLHRARRSSRSRRSRRPAPAARASRSPARRQLLDSLGDRLMYRLAYRNFGDHESLVVNHSVDGGHSDRRPLVRAAQPGGTPTRLPAGHLRARRDVTAGWAARPWTAAATSRSASAPRAAPRSRIRYAGRLATDPPACWPRARAP